ncbi:MAG: DUF1707 domain-containing protein [Streptosporangiaceae bacterium]
MSSRPGPADLRASDADRERVADLLAAAAADGRLTPDEHAERVERAYAARTLGELARLTTDLADPAGQPIRLDSGRVITGFFRGEQRDGRWVVPDRLSVAAVGGTVTLDLREALLSASRVTVYATLLAGQLELKVPEGVAVEFTGSSLLSRRRVRGGPLPPAAPGTPVIEIRLLAAAGTVTVFTPRPPRWRPLSRRR